MANATKVRRQAGSGSDLAIEAMLEDFRGQVFNLLLVASSLTLGVVAIRGFLFTGIHPLDDLITLAAMMLGYGLLRRYPGWRRPASWGMLLCLLLDGLHGIIPWHPQPLSPAHMLLPLLVLYGVLLGDIAMSLVSMAIVLGIYGATAWHFRPVAGLFLAELSNLAILTVCAGLLSLAVSKYHNLLIKRLKAQAFDLRRELEENLQLQSIIFHDIANPLTALKIRVDLLGIQPQFAGEAGHLDNLTTKIFSIIRSVRQLTARQSGTITLVPVDLAEVANSLRETFQQRLAEKTLELDIQIQEGAVARSHGEILEHSILSNLLSNAIKFSPRGSRISLAAIHEGCQIHLVVRNAGAPLGEDVFEGLNQGRPYASSRGTEGEPGSGYGLHIVALTLAKLQGSLEIRNEADSIAVQVSLPAA